MSEDNTFHANERLREERLLRGWSQQDLADRLGIAIVTVNRWERGKQRPAAHYRLKLSTLFGKSEQALGLAEDTSERAPNKEEEEQENMYTVDTAPTEREDLARLPDETLLQRSALEQASPPETLFHPQATLAASLWRTRRKTMLFLLVLVLFVIGAPITFFIIRSTTASSHSSHSSKSSPAMPSSGLGKLVINDTLAKPDGESQWQYGGDTCSFSKNALYMSLIGTGYCSANVQPFSNMIYQIDMVLHKGLWAGVTFRANDNSDMYYFSTSVQGTYEVDVLGPGRSHSILLQNSSSAIHVGYDKTNILRVEANQSHLSFFVNNHMLGSANDTTFSSGYVGSCVGRYNDPSPDILTVASFTNALVWQL